MWHVEVEESDVDVGLEEGPEPVIPSDVKNRGSWLGIDDPAEPFVSSSAKVRQKQVVYSVNIQVVG